MTSTTLSEELGWRGFVNQTTFSSTTELDKGPITFYWGVDPSAPSMTIGNLAAAMMVRHFINYGHNAVLLVGGATGMIGDPDGKSEERSLKTIEEIQANKEAIVDQYKQIFGGQDFKLVDNYDWFKDMGYLQFLREVGKHVPMRQMLNRDFVQSRLGENGAGISYAEFSYVLIQAYDYLYMNKEMGVTLQVCGSDQWGNSIAGVDLIRRVTGNETHVWSTPLVINKSTGVKFGKSEEGAIWLSPELTSPNDFYQFWINLDDEGVEDYLKIYTLLSKQEVYDIIEVHKRNPSQRHAQKRLALEVTKLVHGEASAMESEAYVSLLAGAEPLENIGLVHTELLRKNNALIEVPSHISLTEVLTKSGLATSNNDARRLIASGGVTVMGKKVSDEKIPFDDFVHNNSLNCKVALLRRGKKLKDSVILIQV